MSLWPNHSDFQIVQTPHAIASPAAILARGAMNRIINPSPMHTAPSQDVLSAILFLIQFFILVSFMRREVVVDLLPTYHPMRHSNVAYPLHRG